jgi:hypothetical protein
MSQPTVSVKTYAFSLLALLGLALLTSLLGLRNPGHFIIIVAVLIALAKAAIS